MSKAIVQQYAYTLRFFTTKNISNTGGTVFFPATLLPDATGYKFIGYTARNAAEAGPRSHRIHQPLLLRLQNGSIPTSDFPWLGVFDSGLKAKRRRMVGANK